MDRYIELTASSYDEAKKTITNDAYLNGKRFAGENEDEDKDKHTEKQNNGRKSRSKSKRRSRSTSRGKENFNHLFVILIFFGNRSTFSVNQTSSFIIEFSSISFSS